MGGLQIGRNEVQPEIVAFRQGIPGTVTIGQANAFHHLACVDVDLENRIRRRTCSVCKSAFVATNGVPTYQPRILDGFLTKSWRKNLDSIFTQYQQLVAAKYR